MKNEKKKSIIVISVFSTLLLAAIVIIILQTQKPGMDSFEYVQNLITPNTNQPVEPSQTNQAESSQAGITLANFNKIKKGMTLSEVEAIFDEEGKLASSTLNSVSYSWSFDNEYQVTMEFENNIVVYASQSGLK